MAKFPRLVERFVDHLGQILFRVLLLQLTINFQRLFEVQVRLLCLLLRSFP